MNRILPLFAGAVAFACCAGAQVGSVAITSGEGELRATMEDCRKAGVDGDIEKMAACLTDDYHQTDISGDVQDKQTWLNEYFKPLAELIKSGKFRWETYERTDVQIRIHGNCAVVIGALRLKGVGARPGPQHAWVPDPEYVLQGTLRFTHVYLRENGKWRLTALHNQMPPPAPRQAN